MNPDEKNSAVQPGIIDEPASARTGTVDFAAVRRELGLSQTEFAALLAVSPRTVQSCEQGWRKPSPAVEKSALLLLLSSRNGPRFRDRTCWNVVDCPPHVRQGCLAYLSRQGHLCWFLTGTICQGERQDTWREKISICLQCIFFKGLLQGNFPSSEQENDSSFRVPGEIRQDSGDPPGRTGTYSQDAIQPNGRPTP